MKLFSICVVFCVLSVAFGYGSSGRLKNHPDHPGKCWSDEKLTAYSPGERFTIQCVESTCLSAGDNVFVFTYEHCGHPGSSGVSCKYEGFKYDLDFPQCCPKVVC